ncbi:MAG: YlbF family regulator [Clostridia bacterium]|nr:YlbF family regulator [Clostridia bacterium]
MAVNVYDTANLLAQQLKQTEEYTEYKRLKELAYEDSTNKALLDELKRLQFKMQAKAASGEKPDEEEMQKLMRISSLLQLNQDAGAYLLAEFRFQKLLADIYKILGDVAGIDIDALTQA